MRRVRRRAALTVGAGVSLLVAAGAVGCGGCGHRAGPRRPAHRATASPRPYRWLVTTSGAAPAVAAENRRRGTTAWRLSGGPPSQLGGARSGDVEGYVAAQAIAPGQTQRIYVQAPRAHTVSIRVFRMGWYGGTGGREVLRSARLRVVAQPPCAHRPHTGLTECDWHATLSFKIPPALPSGVYLAKLTASRGQSDVLFVVRSLHPAPLLAMLPTSTYEAYNAWGGDSLYPGGSDRVGATGTSQGVAVSYDRPYDSITGAGQFFARDVALVRFLERYGYPVAYTTSESVDSEPAQLRGHRALIDFGHSEYWSQREADGFAHARDAGTSLLFLSSDTLAWRVRFAPASPASSEPGQPGHVIIAYKERAALDPDRRLPSGAFPAGGAGLTGSAYLGCITPRLSVPGPPSYRYYAWTPTTFTPAWLFAGTGLGPGSSVAGIVGYELDQRTPQTPAGTRLIGAGSAPCMPAEPGEPNPGPGRNRAETTLETARSGALVFSSGTLGWELGLEPVPSASPDAPRAPDPRLVRLTRNLLDRVLGR